MGVSDNNGWKEIRIISSNDNIPSDELLIDLFKKSVEYLNTGHSWIKFNIDKSTCETGNGIHEIDFGELRKIKEKDLEAVKTASFSY